MQYHVLFKGKVQGVGFRAYLKEQAEKYGIVGWCHNLEDGDVQAVFVGEDLEPFLNVLYAGPAEIEEVIVEEEPEEVFAGFERKN